jgi:hypothetical protein
MIHCGDLLMVSLVVASIVCVGLDAANNVFAHFIPSRTECVMYHRETLFNLLMLHDKQSLCLKDVWRGTIAYLVISALYVVTCMAVIEIYLGYLLSVHISHMFSKWTIKELGYYKRFVADQETVFKSMSQLYDNMPDEEPKFYLA